MGADVLKVEDNLAAIMPTRCSIIVPSMDTNMQLSAFTQEATECASLSVNVLNADLKINVESFYKDDYDVVMTHIGGLSIFLELGLPFVEDVCTERISKDMTSDEELANNVLTHVGGWSLFVEHDMTTHRQFQGSISIDKRFDQVLGLSKMLASTGYTQGTVSVCFSNPDILSHTIKQMKVACQSLIHFTQKSSSQLVRTLEATSFFHAEHLLVTWLCRTWDPGASRFPCGVLNNKIFATNINVSFLNLLIHLHVWEDGKSTALAMELYVQWDPGIINIILMDAMPCIGKLSLTQGAISCAVVCQWGAFPECQARDTKLCSVENSFQFLAAGGTCSFSSCSNLCTVHQRDTAMAPIRIDAFKGIASDFTEYGIKIDHRSQVLGILEGYPTSQFVVVFVLFRGRQLLVFPSICKGQDFCSLAISANKLQHMTWNPGVHLSVSTRSVKVTAAGARDICDNASFLRRSYCRIWSYIMFRLRHGQAVAWGQATFCRGGSVTPEHGHVLGQEANGLWTHWRAGLVWSLQRRARATISGIKQNRTG